MIQYDMLSKKINRNKYKNSHKFFIAICYVITGVNLFNPQAPVAQKSADEVVFDVSKVKESSFLKSDLTDPLSNF